ncbi:MAG: hypothetical protein Fur0010_02550 [Bdellovibrio sp.]
MKVIFFSSDEGLVQLVESLENENVLLSDDDEQILEWLDDIPEGENGYLVIDFDDDQKKREKFSGSLVKNEWLFRFIASEKLSLKELKKHQKGKTAAHAYLRKPFKIEQLEEAINEIELALYLEEHPEEDDSGFQYISLKSNFQIPSSSNLVQGSDEEKNFEEMKISTEVRKIVEAHSGTARALQNSELNKKIQAKFDFVFGENVTSYNVSDPNSDMELPEWEERTTPGHKLKNEEVQLEEDSEDDLILELPEESEDEVDIDIDTSSAEDEIVIEEDVGDEIEIEEEHHDDIEISLDSSESKELSFDDNEDEIELPAHEDEIVLSADGSETDETQEDDQVLLPDDSDLELPDITPKAKEAVMSNPKDKTGELCFDDDNEVKTEDLEFAPSAVEEEELKTDSGLEFDTSSIEVESNTKESTGEEMGFELSDDGDEEGLDLGVSVDEGIELGDETATEEDSEQSLELSENEGDSGFEIGDDEGAGEELDLGGADLDLGSEGSAGDPEMSLGDEDSILTEEDVEITPDDFNEASGELNLSEIQDNEEEVILSDDEVHNEDTGSFSDDELLGDDVDDGTDATVVMTKSSQTPAFEDLEAAEEAVEIEEDIINENTGEFDELVVDEADDIGEVSDATLVMPSPSAKIEETKTLTKTNSQVASASSKNINVEDVSPEKGQMSFSGSVEHASTYVNEGDLVRLQATIRQLREEREKLLAEIKHLKVQNKELEQENIGLRAEIDDAKVEITILKRRQADEVDELKYRLKLSEEKRQVVEEKNKHAQKEIERLEGKLRLDIGQVKQREKELEAKLELVTMDSDAQVKTRDMKILELKRKIDQLEFNMENAIIREQKSREDKIKLEDRLQRIMKTLRGSIQLLEDDMNPDVSNLIKKSELKE